MSEPLIHDLASAQAFIRDKRRHALFKETAICVSSTVFERIARDLWGLHRFATPENFPAAMLRQPMAVWGVQITKADSDFRLDEFNGKVGDKAERRTVKLSEVTIAQLWAYMWNWRVGVEWGHANAPSFPGIAALQESHPDGLIILGVKIEVVK